MIILSSPQACGQFGKLIEPVREKGLTTSRILMVSPDHFKVSKFATQNNVYMGTEAVDPSKAWEQFNELLRKLEARGIEVNVFPGKPGQSDGIFPNNTFATVRGIEGRKKRALIGMMLNEDRIPERDQEDIREFLRSSGYEFIDLQEDSRAQVGKDSAELTGSVVIDHRRDFGFIGLSKRCTFMGAMLMAEAFGFNAAHVFELTENEYHTNVVLAILGGKVCVIAPSGFKNEDDAKAIMGQYQHVIHLTEEQKNHFCGNMLALGDSHVFLSHEAWIWLRGDQRDALKEAGFTVNMVDISELEKGGGSMRCLLCELW
ncbi:hypothetical protein KKH43_00425 [Patescibacteria group bacterium]|nr:hypothetical protein [Patescibacteria group bacterium]